MKHRLNLDIKDPNYILLKKIFKIIDSRKSLQILASYGFKNLNKQILHLISIEETKQKGKNPLTI